MNREAQLLVLLDVVVVSYFKRQKARRNLIKFGGNLNPSDGVMQCKEVSVKIMQSTTRGNVEKIIVNIEGIIQSVHKNLECSICLEVLVEPYATRCNHKFCRKCINELLSRNNRKSGASCPLCKSKLSKRGLAQNKNLVSVVGAVRNVLQAINEDAKLYGIASPTIAVSQTERKHDLREETPSQILDRCILPDKNDIATSSSMKIEEIVKENVSKGNTRRSRKLCWSEIKNNEQNVPASDDLLQTLKSSKLGRKTKKSTRDAHMPLRQDKQLVSLNQDSTIHCRIRHRRNMTSSKRKTRSSDLLFDTSGFPITERSPIGAGYGACRNERMETDPSEIGIQNCVTTTQKFAVAETPQVKIPTVLHEHISSELRSYVESETKPSPKKVSPFAETPPIPITTKSTEDTSCKATSHIDSGARPVAKKISPFAESACAKAVIETRSPNMFDFVDDHNSDICESMKRRAKGANRDRLSFVRNKAMSSKITAKGDSIITETLGAELDSKGKKRKGRKAISKKQQDLNSKPGENVLKPGINRVRFRTKSLLEEAWNADRDGSQVIESGHTDDCVETCEAGDPMECNELVETNAIGIKYDDDMDVAGNLETQIAGSPVISLENQNSVGPALEAASREKICSQSKEKSNAVNKEVDYKGSDESDIVPSSVPTPDASLVNVINPMECQLYDLHSQVHKEEIIALDKGSPEIQSFRKMGSSEEPGTKLDKIVQKLQLAKSNCFVRVADANSACNSAMEIAESEKTDLMLHGKNSMGNEAVMEQRLDMTVSNQNFDNKQLSLHLFSEPIASESCNETDKDLGQKTDRSRIENEVMRTGSCSKGSALHQAEKGTVFAVNECNCKITNEGDTETFLETFNDKRSSQKNTLMTAKGVELVQSITEGNVDKLEMLRKFAEPNSKSTCENIAKEDRPITDAEETYESFTPSVKNNTPRSDESDLFSQETYFNEDCANRKLVNNESECGKGSEMTEERVVVSMPIENLYMTQEDLSQGSASILHRLSQLEIASNQGKKMVNELNLFAEDVSATALKRDAFTQANVSTDVVAIEVSGVSKACQTENGPTRDANFAHLQAAGHRTGAVDVNSFSMNSNCQLCIGCQRNMHDSPIEIFKVVKTNIREAVEQHRSKKLTSTLKDGRYSLNLGSSGLIAGPQRLASLDKCSVTMKDNDGGIGISRLSFVPDWPDPRLGDKLKLDDEDELEARSITRNVVEDAVQQPCLRRGCRLKNASQPDCSIKAIPEESNEEIETYENADNEETVEANLFGNLAFQDACDNPSSQEESDDNIAEEVCLATETESAKLDVDCLKSRDVIPPTPLSPVQLNLEASTVIPSLVMETSTFACLNKDEMGSQEGLDYKLSLKSAKDSGRSGSLEELEGSNRMEGKLKDSIFSEFHVHDRQKSDRDPSLGNEANKQAGNSLCSISKELLLDVNVASQGNSNESVNRLNLKRKAKIIPKDDLSSQNLAKKIKIEDSENRNEENRSNKSSQAYEAQIQSSQICSGIMIDSYGDVSSQIVLVSAKNKETDQRTDSKLHAPREPKGEIKVEVEIKTSSATLELQLREQSFQITERNSEVINDSQTIILLDTPKVECGMSRKDIPKIDQNKLHEDFEMNVGTNQWKERVLQENKSDICKEGRCSTQTETEREWENVVSEVISCNVKDFQDDNEHLNKNDDSARNLMSEEEPDFFDSSGRSLVKLADTLENYQDGDCISEEDQLVNEFNEPDEAEEEAICHADETTLLYPEEQKVHSGKIVNELLEDGGVGFPSVEKTVPNSSKCHADDISLLYLEGQQVHSGKTVHEPQNEPQNSPQSKMYSTFILDDERQIFDSYDDKDQHEKEAASEDCSESNLEDFFTPAEKANSENRASGLKDSSKSDFKNLVKEVTKAQDTSSQGSVENNDDDLFVKPCTQTGKESRMTCVSSMDVDSRENELLLGQNKEQVGERDDCSPPSPTPPPRLKRKRSSPPEIQATLKELKKVLYTDDVPRNASLNDKAKQSKLQHQRASSKLLVVVANEVARRTEKCNHSSKILGVKDHVEGTHEAAKRNQYMEHKTDFLKTNVPNETVKREIITTPIIKAEKRGIMERRMTSHVEQAPENISKNEKRIVLPKIITPSRLSRKEISYCKYFAEKMGSKFSTSFIPGTTHLVMCTDENMAIDRSYYTYKYLMALITGSWIVSLKWVLACFQAGRPVPEDSFEVKGDPSSSQELVPSVARISKQKEEPPLFDGLTLTLIGNFKTSQMTKDQLVEMLTIGGAKVLHELPDVIPPKNFLLIADQEALDAQLQSQLLEAGIQAVNYEWITESIINYKVQDPLDFLFSLKI